VPGRRLMLVAGAKRRSAGRQPRACIAWW
jgi:hypothetical protein